LIKVEAFPYMDVAVVRVIGVCTGGSHEAPACVGHSLITQVDVQELEALGVTNALVAAVRRLLDADQDLAGYLMH